MHLYLCGFTVRKNEIIPYVYLIQFRYDTNKNFQKIKENKRKTFDYGLSWAGEGMWIISKLLKLTDPKNGIKEANIVYNLFSLKDGIAFGNYLICTVIGFEKSQSRFPTCGGKVQIAALTPREFQFVNLDESIDLTI